jgi:hypothetical protein
MSDKRVSAERYWTRIFIPCVLILFALFMYILFTLPQLQVVSAEIVQTAIRRLNKNTRTV